MHLCRAICCSSGSSLCACARVCLAVCLFVGRWVGRVGSVGRGLSVCPSRFLFFSLFLFLSRSLTLSLSSSLSLLLCVRGRKAHQCGIASDFLACVPGSDAFLLLRQLAQPAAPRWGLNWRPAALGFARSVAACCSLQYGLRRQERLAKLEKAATK